MGPIFFFAANLHHQQIRFWFLNAFCFRWIRRPLHLKFRSSADLMRTLTRSSAPTAPLCPYSTTPFRACRSDIRPFPSHFFYFIILLETSSKKIMANTYRCLATLTRNPWLYLTVVHLLGITAGIFQPRPPHRVPCGKKEGFLEGGVSCSRSLNHRMITQMHFFSPRVL